MLLFNASRIDMLTCIAPHGVAAEIGVATGYYAEHLVKSLNAKEIHLIDPWRHMDVADYAMDANNTTDDEGDRRYQDILTKFDQQLRTGTIKVHRACSTDIARSFPDEYFDFVYIDANHTYAGCLADLRTFDRKVKRTGFICGHDYQTIPIAKAHHNGVVQAVHNFVIEREYSFLALTFEEAPTYVIAKDPNTPEAVDFVTAMAKKYQIMAQIVNPEHKVFEQIELPFAPQRYIFSFD